MRIVETDNLGRDYPNERFVLWSMGESYVTRIASVLNEWGGPQSERCYKIVEDDYALAPGFEP